MHGNMLVSQVERSANVFNVTRHPPIDDLALASFGRRLTLALLARFARPDGLSNVVGPQNLAKALQGYILVLEDLA